MFYENELEHNCPDCYPIGFTILNYCKKEDSAATEIKPPGKVTTSGVVATSSNGGILASHVADMGGAEFYVRGVCIDTIPDPDTVTVWYSVNTGKLCPVGWHVPTREEWEEFAHHIGNDLKKSYWIKAFDLLNIENTIIRDVKDDIKGWHDHSHTPELKPQWWSSSVSGPDSAWYFKLDYFSGILSEYNRRNGLAVRCLKDK